MKYFLLILFLLSFIFSFGIIDLTPLWLSFVFNLAIFFYLFKDCFNKKLLNPFLIITFIFFYLFFFIAPIVQLKANNVYLLNGLLINVNDAVLANICIVIFYIIVFKSEKYFARKNKSININKYIEGNKLTNKNQFILNICVISLVTTAFCFSYIVSTFNKDIGTSIYEDKSSVLLMARFITVIPFACLLILMHYKDSIDPGKFWLSFFLIVLCVLILKNPISEKRNSIGPIYLTIIFFLGQKRFKKNKQFFFLNFIVFLIFFPLSSMLTHTYGGINSRISSFTSILNFNDMSDIIESHFSEIHYDAWEMMVSTVQYIHLYSFSLGYSLLGSIFFFVPRSLWITKPFGTGQIVAENYISRFGLEFSNVSCPLPAEGYFNFGILGVIIFAIFIGYTFVKGFRIVHSNSVYKYLAIYGAFYLFFLYRGDLMNGIAYFMGIFASFVFVKNIVFFKLKGRR